MIRNQNPRIGVLLCIYGASSRLKTVLWCFHKRGLKWLRANWPEMRMRRELRGYGPKCSREWQAILARRSPERRLSSAAGHIQPMTEATSDFIQNGRPFKAVWSVHEGGWVICDATGYIHAKCDDDQDAAEAIAEKLNDA